MFVPMLVAASLPPWHHSTAYARSSFTFIPIGGSPTTCDVGPPRTPPCTPHVRARAVTPPPITSLPLGPGDSPPKAPPPPIPRVPPRSPTIWKSDKTLRTALKRRNPTRRTHHRWHIRRSLDL